MKQEKQFYNRLKYAPHTFRHHDTAVPAYRHTNPDGSLGGWVAETALVEETCHLDPKTEVFEYASVKDSARILEEAIICEFGEITGKAVVDDYSMVCGNAKIGGYAYVGGNSIVAGDTKIGGYNEVISEVLE